MIGLLLGLAVLAAVLGAALRRWQRARSARCRPGASIHQAVPVSRFDEIDAVLYGRGCDCGGRLRLGGETSCAAHECRFRIVRLICSECEHDQVVYFDVTAAFH